MALTVTDECCLIAVTVIIVVLFVALYLMRNKK